MERLLTICIPTYNRKDVLLNDVRKYLSSKDQRFAIKINDNASNDGTFESLSLINDERLEISRNQINIGVGNGVCALSNSQSEYILFLLDKDTVDIKELPNFIDYLENDRPYFGYIDLNLNSDYSIENISAGLSSILRVAYLCKHPSGFFWRKDIFEEEMKKDFYKEEKVSKFDFMLDLVNGPIASKYPASIVYMPLIINANLRKDLPKGKYKGSFGYNASNVWFGKEKRIFEYQTYLRSALSLDIPVEDKQKLVLYLTDKGISTVTTGLYDIMQNKASCEHYHLHTRVVSIKEMYKNTIEILNNLTEISRDKLPSKFIKKTKCYLFLKSVARCAKRKIKAIYTKPHSGMSA